jgi:ribonuclease HII
MKKGRKRSKPTSILESRLHKYQGHKRIAGCDEVGVGALAGPVVVAAVVLDPRKKIMGLNDSKKLSPRKREVLALEIKQKAKDYFISFYPPAVVDRLNPHECSRLGMEACVRALITAKPTFVITDAMKLKNCLVPHKAVVRGDQKSVSVAAASILAKVARDQYMVELDKRYPEFGFAINKGYGTKEHLEALMEFGPSPEHRLTYRPVQASVRKLPEYVEWVDFSL